MPSDVFINVLAGGMAGMVETVLTYPLDLAKTRQQLSAKPSGSTFSVLSAAYREGGAFGLYRGLAAPVLAETPRRALKFTMNGIFTARLRAVFHGELPLASGVALAAAAGSMAGASETLIHTPVEVVKIRMQAGGHAADQGPLTIARDVFRRSGLRGLYSGLEAYALRQALWNGCFFGIIGLGKQTLPAERFGGSAPARDFTVGLLAGSTATCINNPLDVAKSRIQHTGLQRWSGAVVMDVAAAEGLRGLCKGLPARLYRSAPGHGLLYMGYEFFASALRKRL